MSHFHIVYARAGQKFHLRPKPGYPPHNKPNRSGHAGPRVKRSSEGRIGLGMHGSVQSKFISPSIPNTDRPSIYLLYFFYMLIKTCWMQRCRIIFYIYIPSIFTLPPSAITKNPSSRKAHSSSPSPPLFLTLLFQHSLHSDDSSINLVTLQVICLFPNSIRPRSNFLSHTLLFFFLNLSWPILNCQRIVVYHAFFVTDW